VAATFAACGTGNVGDSLAGMDANVLGRPDQPSGAAEALQKAEALRSTGKPVQALAELADAHRRFPGDTPITSAYGRVALLLGHDDIAAPLLAEAIEANPRDWRALSAQGVLESRKGRLPDARRALVSASQISAGEAVILNNLAVSHLLEGEGAAAESLLRQGLAARELRPRHAARLKRNLGLALALQGRFEEADKLAGERLPRDLASADAKRLRQLLGVSEVKVAAGSGWTTQIGVSQPRPEPALR
jgi:Flp pilus assembly protein TadD